MAFTQVTVTGTFATPSGALGRGRVRFTLTEPMSNGGDIVAAVPVIASLDGSGEISINLYATTDPDTETDSGEVAHYFVEYLLVGQRARSFRVALSHADTTQDLADLDPES